MNVEVTDLEVKHVIRDRRVILVVFSDSEIDRNLCHIHYRPYSREIICLVASVFLPICLSVILQLNNTVQSLSVFVSNMYDVCGQPRAAVNQFQFTKCTK